MTGFALLGGAVVGSAAGAALHRWPRGATLLRPSRSRCAACGGTLRAIDLVPVISWVLCRGRCRICSSRIDARLPLLEATSGVGTAFIVRMHGPTVLSVLLSLGVVAVLLATLTDLETMTVPNRLSLPLAAVSLVGMAAIAGDAGAVRSVVVWGLGLPLGLHVFSQAMIRIGLARPIGGGDVKLLIGVLALASAVSGGPGTVLAIAVLTGGCIAAAGLLSGRLRRGDRMPFAPSIALGYLAVVLAPDEVGRILSTLGSVA